MDDLNRHVASLAVLFHQYLKHHWVVEAPHFRDLHDFLEVSYREVQANLDEIAERVTVLGGIPLSSPDAQVTAAYTRHEGEDTVSLRQMLENDLEAEQKVISALRRTVETSSASKDFGSERLVKSVLYAAENRAHHLDQYLENDTLSKHIASNGRLESH